MCFGKNEHIHQNVTVNMHEGESYYTAFSEQQAFLHFEQCAIWLMKIRYSEKLKQEGSMKGTQNSENITVHCQILKRM